ncbi:thioredoxin family protein [Tropicibacter sp. R15_0]|uniref:protein-disulfide reductase DsbD family protein n=1 Tax=Tropicibacter sp. R15_0 TaxID=2821101 RepID=UPI001ADB904B|nr:protein-disulfide reductase DsbD domain-containing protein [Tropicibacter sp. R15_0]MBO9467176.1 thioredoxin family protein [Tropicibacter sp. R15_0]
MIDCLLILRRVFLVPFVLLVLVSGSVSAATSSEYQSAPLTAYLISAQDGVPENTQTLSAGLRLQLNEDWKTYWRSPGEVGIPPSVEWSGSENVADVEFMWPAPTRFTAFGIENFGYADEVVFPLRVTLKEPGAPVTLSAQVKLLVCSSVCVPEEFDLSLRLRRGNGIDGTSAGLIGAFSERVPEGPEAGGVSEANAFINEDLTELVVSLRVDDPFQSPDVFPELGAGVALGKPDIRLGEEDRLLWARLPILSSNTDVTVAPSITVTDGENRSFTVIADRVTRNIAPPFELTTTTPDMMELLWIAAIALLGGLILNVMPCVLPVLSIKVSSVLKHTDHDTTRVRFGFVAAGAGIIAFMWGLALILWALQMAGLSVGWGLQFQSPLFLAVMIAVLLVFSANLFGAFEFALPHAMQTRLAGAGGRSGYSADFFTGMFGAILATPCSAPFLGTAVAFALAGRGVDILIVFTSLGLGLALPYLVIAAFPRLVAFMPKPGRWMLVVKSVMGILLLATAVWLFWVLEGVAGLASVIAVAMLSGVAVLILSLTNVRPQLRWSIATTSLVLALVAGPLLQQSAPAQSVPQSALTWVAFDRSHIAKRVSEGEVVFVDVTADWCLTCKANKTLVIDREPVRSALDAPGVTPMQADWTRPDARISRYLESFGRYGIPFNAVYGPSAPNGIVLSELLTTDDVLNALSQAGGRDVPATISEQE